MRRTSKKKLSFKLLKTICPKAWSFAKKMIYHPFLVAIFPILSLYYANQRETYPSLLITPVVITLFGVAIIFLLINLAVKNLPKSSLITTLFIFEFFYYSKAIFILEKLKLFSLFKENRTPFLCLLAVILGIGIFLIIRTKKNLSVLSNTLTVISLVMVIISIGQIALYAKRTDFKTATSTTNFLRTAGKTEFAEDKPDIYYIILDEYARADNLKEFYGYDNSEFIKYLRDKGFYVADKSTNNYGMTYLSLASSLNMDYLPEDLEKQTGSKANNMSPAYNLINSNKVGEKVKAESYKYIHIASGWGGSNRSPLADSVVSNPAMNEFQITILKTTVLKEFENYLGGVSQRDLVLGQFDTLQSIPQDKKSTFTFVHITSPHPPYVFNENGSLATKATFKFNGDVYLEKDGFVKQITYLNKIVRETIDKIIADSSKPPIIVVQADHGTAVTFVGRDYDAWQNPKPDNIKERFGILCALYLPDSDNLKVKPYESISPVNIFRLVFNNYFDSKYELLEEKSYYSSYNEPYKFKNIEELLK